jgi:hypothetical protein
LRTYRLDIHSIVEEENHSLWNPEDDIVYILPVWRWWENNTILTWLSQRRPEDKPISSMVSLQHMALKFSPELSACFGLSGLSLDGVSRDQWTLEHE